MAMSQRLIKLASIMFAFLILFSACDDDNGTDPNNNAGKNFFPLKLGNYWLYTIVTLDENSGEKVQGTEIKDSTVASGPITLKEKTGVLLERYHDDGVQPADSDYVMRDEEGRIFNYLDLVPEDLLGDVGDLPIDTPIDWYKVADFEEDTWTLFSQDVPEFDLTIDGIGTVPVSGTLSATAEKGTTQNISIGGNETVSAQEFIVKIKPGLKARVSNNDIPLQGELTVRLYFAEEIGLVRYIQEPLYLYAIVIVEREVVRAAGEQWDLTAYVASAEED